MPLELLTIEDLHQFRGEMILEFKKMLSRKDNVDSKKLLKSREVRKLLRISTGTLQNLRRNETLRFTKVGGTIYYEYKDIERLVSRGK